MMPARSRRSRTTACRRCATLAGLTARRARRAWTQPEAIEEVAFELAGTAVGLAGRTRQGALARSITAA